MTEDDPDESATELAEHPAEPSEPIPEITPRKVKRRRRSVRQRGVPRKRSIPTKRLTLAKIAEEWRILGSSAKEPYWRPETRADCAKVARPCQYVACKHHNYLDVNPETGTITLNWPGIEPADMPVASCSLDVADRGGITLEETGEIMNLTRERVRQIEVRALVRKLRVKYVEIGLDTSSIVDRKQGALADAGNSEDGCLPSEVSFQSS